MTKDEIIIYKLKLADAMLQELGWPLDHKQDKARYQELFDKRIKLRDELLEIKNSRA